MKNIMKKTLEKIINYFYVGLFPNCLGVYAIYEAINSVFDNRFSFFACVAVTYCSLVGYSEFRQYFKVKKALKKHGWDERIVKPKSYSWCQRHAIKQAAKQTGYISEYKAFMKKEGHEWYHILPKVHRFNEI